MSPGANGAGTDNPGQLRQSSASIRVADLVFTSVLFVGFTLLTIFLAGVLAYLGLGPEPCLESDRARCTDRTSPLELVTIAVLVAFALVWAASIVQIVRRARSGRMSWPIPIQAGGVVALLLVVGAVLISWVD